jgi:hypothetical protein
MDKIGYALAILLALFGLAAGAVLYELLQQYPAGSHGKDAILFGLLLAGALCAGNIIVVLAPVFSNPEKYKRRPKMLPIVLIEFGICMIVLGAAIHFVERPVVDNDFLFYSVDIRDPHDTRAQLPVFITSKSPSPFENVDCWWAPWGSEKNIYPTDPSNPYWSIGQQMKVVHPLVRGGGMYGRSISAGDYLIQYNTTFKGLNFHFDEHLNIQAHDGQLTQEIEVWKTQTPDGEKILVYSTIPSKRPIT